MIIDLNNFFAWKTVYQLSKLPTTNWSLITDGLIPNCRCRKWFAKTQTTAQRVSVLTDRNLERQFEMQFIS